MQEIRNLAPAEIVDQRVPVEMPPLPLVGMLVQRSPVELRQSVRIVGKMPRHPVQNDREAGAMAGIDQGRKSSGGPNRLVGAYSPVG